ncbi:hypothetical protein F5883DRAFT_98001 [Diaporthe sp. PMI_573]|nr:hypothetical protein F5883DRAFT_98001 [Diaporthaceae sp. PMI_573]
MQAVCSSSILCRFASRAGGGTNLIRRKTHGEAKKGTKESFGRVCSLLLHPPSPPRVKYARQACIFLLACQGGFEGMGLLSVCLEPGGGAGPSVSGRYSTVGGRFDRLLPMQSLMKEGFGTEGVQMDGGKWWEGCDAPAEGFCDWRRRLGSARASACSQRPRTVYPAARGQQNRLWLQKVLQRTASGITSTQKTHNTLQRG